MITLKRLKLWILLILISITISYSLPSADASNLAYQPRPRFEMILSENVGDDIYDGRLQVFHDKETGQEFICRYHRTYTNSTCWLTGRVWY